MQAGDEISVIYRKTNGFFALRAFTDSLTTVSNGVHHQGPHRRDSAVLLFMSLDVVSYLSICLG